MPYQSLQDGLYLARRPANAAKIVDHYGVIDVGNRLGFAVPPNEQALPVVVHQTTEGIKAEWLEGRWEVEAAVGDEAGAIARIQLALKTPQYDLFGNNCEHFARFVTSGSRESKQLQTVAVVGVAGFALWALTQMDSKNA